MKYCAFYVTDSLKNFCKQKYLPFFRKLFLYLENTSYYIPSSLLKKTSDKLNEFNMLNRSEKKTQTGIRLTEKEYEIFFAFKEKVKTLIEDEGIKQKKGDSFWLVYTLVCGITYSQMSTKELYEELDRDFTTKSTEVQEDTKKRKRKRKRKEGEKTSEDRIKDAYLFQDDILEDDNEETILQEIKDNQKYKFYPNKGLKIEEDDEDLEENDFMLDDEEEKIVFSINDTTEEYDDCDLKEDSRLLESYINRYTKRIKAMEDNEEEEDDDDDDEKSVLSDSRPRNIYEIIFPSLFAQNGGCIRSDYITNNFKHLLKTEFKHYPHKVIYYLRIKQPYILNNMQYLPSIRDSIYTLKPDSKDMIKKH